MLDLRGVAEQWAEGDSYFQQRMATVDEQLERAQLSLENQATALREWFREERKALQEIAERTKETPVGKRAKSTYAPLNLFTRARNGNLEIYWQEVHRHRATGGKSYKYLKRTEQGNYTPRELMGHAKDFEKDLVALAEQRAQKLRAEWRQTVLLRITLQASLRASRAPIELLTKFVPDEQVVAPRAPELVPSMVA